MKAELLSGEIVMLTKECDCITHREPHWVRMWRKSRDMTLSQIKPLLGRMDAIESRTKGAGGVSFSDFIDHEQLKLAVGAYAGDMARIYGEALGEFKRRGIARLIEEEDDKPNDLDLQRARAFIRSRLPVEPEIVPYVDKATEVRVTARETL